MEKEEGREGQATRLTPKNRSVSLPIAVAIRPDAYCISHGLYSSRVEIPLKSSMLQVTRIKFSLKAVAAIIAIHSCLLGGYFDMSHKCYQRDVMRQRTAEKAQCITNWRRSGKKAWTYAKENGLAP